MLSSFLLAAPDSTAAGGWQAVCKLSNGLTDARLEELHELLATGDHPLMRKLDKGDPLPPWCPTATPYPHSSRSACQALLIPSDSF